jgi:hypothetical protein
MRSRRQPESAARDLSIALAIVAIAFVRPATARPPISEAAAARAEGTRLFRAKKFESACPKFEQAVRLAPEDPEPLADLALCRQRLGSSDTAEDINRKVIDLGSTGKALTDPRFVRSRRHAYFNLYQLNKNVKGRYFPEAQAAGCGELRPEVGCSKRLFYCADSWTTGGTFVTYDVTRVRVAASADDARFDADDDDPQTRENADPDFSELTTPFAPTPDVVENGDSVTYLESYRGEGAVMRCDEQAWSCEGSAAVAVEAKKCVASRGGAPSSAEACARSACGRAQQKPWPAVITERKAAAHGQRACRATATSVDSEYGCQIAYANACTGLVGLICSGVGPHKKEELTRVEEYQFQPPPSRATPPPPPAPPVSN